MNLYLLLQENKQKMKNPGDHSVIEMKCKHECSERCQYTYFLQFPIGKNSNYDPETKRCDLFGKVESISPHIDCWSDLESKYEWEKMDEIVIPYPKVSIEFDYPLKSKFRFEFQSDVSEGFTRKNIVDIICKKYQEIYDEENASLTDPPSTVDERMNKGGLINREKTDGPYGIWGHDLGDLYLEGIEFDSEKNMVSLSIGS